MALSHRYLLPFSRYAGPALGLGVDGLLVVHEEPVKVRPPSLRSPLAPDDLLPEPHHIVLRVNAVAVHRVPPSWELPGPVPPPQRRQADREQPGRLGDRDEVSRIGLLPAGHDSELNQR